MAVTVQAQRGCLFLPPGLLGKWLLGIGLACHAGVGVAAAAVPMSRSQAVRALAGSDVVTRMAALERLADVGRMADAPRVLSRLADDDADVREAAGIVVWKIWNRSGDAKVDQLFGVGVAQMQHGDFHGALITFDEIIRLRPAFAEGWNKRATLYYMIGDFDRSLKDCDEVFKRNPDHFGALAGAGQIHLQSGNLKQALDFLKRAYAVNPNLHSVGMLIPRIEERLRQDAKGRI